MGSIVMDSGGGGRWVDAPREPLAVAGAFTIDSKGAGYIQRIDGDPHAVVGLSIPLLRTLVRELGYSWHDLWNR